MGGSEWQVVPGLDAPAALAALYVIRNFPSLISPIKLLRDFVVCSLCRMMACTWVVVEHLDDQELGVGAGLGDRDSVAFVETDAPMLG